MPARRQEVVDLRRGLLAARILVLHSPSGAGKSSLIAAHNGLRGEMQRRGFNVRRSARVGQPPPSELAGIVNRYELSVLRDLAGDEPIELRTLTELGLVGWLDAHRGLAVDASAATGDDVEDAPRPRELLIFDQFEEILTADPNDDRGRGEFLDTLARALDDPYRWALFVLREDYLGALDPWARRLPTLLSQRFRIDLLGADGAREAIRTPAATQGVEFAEAALEHLVDELRLTAVQRLDGTIERRSGLWVEPVQLQVVCRRLWSQLATDCTRVELADVQALGDVDAALADFYDDQVRTIAATSIVSERHLRDWIGTRLISPAGVRTPVMRGPDVSEGLSNRALEALETAHLIRGEERRGVKWYELAHDRLVAPVRASNAAWAQDHLHAVQLQAALWQRQGEGAELLLTDEALPAAEAWAAGHSEDLTHGETQYLARSREKAGERARERDAAARLVAEQARRLRLLLIGAAALAVAAMLVVAALAWGLNARAEAAEREQLARRFTEMVEQIESLARESALSPLHDIRGEQQAIRGRIAELEVEIARAGPVAVASGRYAQGRGYLALGEHDRALAALDEAWQRGLREPRVAYALALVHGHLYQDQLREAGKIEGEKLREATRREAELRHRDPALAYLEHTASAEVPSPAFVAALVAFYEGRLDEALDQLGSIGDTLPWFYEAPALRGEILVTRAWQRWNHGDLEGATADLAAGRLAYAAAAAIGESAPDVLTAAGELEFIALRIALYSAGDVRTPFERGEQAVRRALQAAPEGPATLLLDARLQRKMAEHGLSRGEPVDAMYQAAAAAAERALALAPGSAPARLELGTIYWQWGDLLQLRGEDPREQLRLALATLDGVAVDARGYDYYHVYGLVFQDWASHDEQTGVDPRPHLDRAIESMTAAVRSDDQPFEAWYNLGSAYNQRAATPHAADPDADARQALAAFDQAHARNPRSLLPYVLGGQIHLLLAERSRARGGAARPELDAALEQYERGLQIDPNLEVFHNEIGATLLAIARDDWDLGGDPNPPLTRARAAFDRAIAAAPEFGGSYHNVGEVLLQRAGYQRARGEDPGPGVREALAAIQTAREHLGENPLVLANLGTVHAIEAAYLLEHGRDPRASLDAAESALHAALAGNPGYAQTHLYLGETHAIRARRTASAAEFEAATAAYQRAIELAPDQHEYSVAFAHACRAWAAAERAAGRDPAAPLRRGLELAERVLTARPEWAEARLVRGSLRLLQAQAASSPQERQAQAARAAADLDAALAANRNLERVWRPQATLAQRLATGRDGGP